MSLVGYVVIFLVGIGILLALFLRHVGKKMYTSTKGEIIKKYENPRKALLVIDVQEGITGRMALKPYKDTEEKIKMINKVIQHASDTGVEVVYIRHAFKDSFIYRMLTRGRLIEGHPGVEIDSRIKVISENNFTKNISDAFSNVDLDKFLITNQVNELYLVGLDAVYCVYYTAIGALNRGYKVNVIEEAILTHKTQEEVAKLYQKSGIKLSSSKTLTEKEIY
ncbi:cysteine hydrolase family protein [Clostridium formicaceticum]|uniref:Nicotinamidase/pyrazinamidase n=1 Tax=Clostridium formicaceticum TaxID=1497 RepID=A0AAC9RPB0_9CLOT|nr:isochorismatase family cysteine hydrolase [Clostridium formicaceticum]AOY74498.1 hypothetical protein BJL90_00130 [Clostridium formicaceticum]ARE88848.1 nicotinamidase/pyrazinamidase [Clostridium formicaceticum]